ncbi:MAG: alpha/beta fold hydrolase [Saprospiraceae bacterium]|nr:alpha/beta fold hydrolase [Saprospiraceae bacterium]
MPLLQSTYPGPPRWQIGGHLQTIVPGAFRNVKGVDYERERIETNDDDFLDLDWLIADGNEKLVVITHGLEADSSAQYVRGAAKLFYQNGWDVLAWNCRSCSGEMNRQFRMYHHGDTEDISTVVDHAIAKHNYKQVCLMGFSMGANITLKYLGVSGSQVPPQVRAAAVFSAPCDIRAGADVLDRWDNVLYKYRFMWFLYKKIKVKAKQFPGKLDTRLFRKVRRWRDFDEFFSAPISGYPSAAAFHQQASAKHFLTGIRVPTLLVSALNDPILTPACFPVDIAQNHDFLHLEITKHGGHCGFLLQGDHEFAWSELRSLEFCTQQIDG